LSSKVDHNILRVTDIEYFHWSVTEADVPSEVALDARPLSLAAAVELALIESNCRAVANRAIFAIASNCPVYRAVKSANWPAQKAPKEIRRNGLVVLVLPGSDQNSWWIEQLKLLRNELIKNEFPEALGGALTGSVGEMVDNAWLHRETFDPPLLAYQVRRKQFAFSVADTGIGVLKSLTQSPKYNWLSSSMEAIEFAIQPGVSRLKNGGMGFPSMIKAMANLWGNARIRSGDAALIIDGTKEIRSNNFISLPELPGLHVSVRCSLDASRARSR
jgi:hypothetical protein